MSETKQIQKGHILSIYNREKIDLDGVLEILSSTDKELIAKLENEFICIVGENLSIIKLIPETTQLTVSGNILGLNYKKNLSKKSLLSKVFK